MSFYDNFIQALSSLRSNKLRTALTMLGVIMGVFSIVAIMAISNATKVYMNEQVGKLGANSILVTYNYNNVDLDSSYYFELSDLDRVREGIEEVEYASCFVIGEGYIDGEDELKSANALGIVGDFEKFNEMDLIEGRFISPEDVTSSRNVIVIEDKYKDKYLGEGSVIGDDLVIYNGERESKTYKIIGVLNTSSDLSIPIPGYEPPETIYIPLTSLENHFGKVTISTLSFAAKNGMDLNFVGNKILRLLNFSKSATNMYNVSNTKTIQNQVASMLNVVSSVLLVIAIITLIVGGIGIVNILLVSVTERIREIGVRKAIGASKKDIVMQFLTESVILTGLSGIIGIILGVVMGFILSAVIQIPPSVDYVTIVLAFFGSIILGVAFGVYPAKKAADLDPIESLRYE